MEEFAEEIDNKICTGFRVNNIPRGVLRKFKKLCKEKYGNIYWVGISELLEIKEKYDGFLALFNSLQNQINELNQKLEEKKNVKTLKTFG